MRCKVGSVPHFHKFFSAYMSRQAANEQHNRVNMFALDTSLQFPKRCNSCSLSAVSSGGQKPQKAALNLHEKRHAKEKYYGMGSKKLSAKLLFPQCQMAGKDRQIN